MNFKFRVSITLLTISFFSCSVPLASMGAAEPSSNANYSQDAKGLEKQFEPLAKAWSKRDDRAIDQAGKIFLLPDATGWFGKYFAKEQVPTLVAEDQKEVKDFATVTPIMMNILAKGQKIRVQIAPAGKPTHPTAEPRADAPVPTTPVPVEQFNVALVGEKGMTLSILCNFVYVDGAYRYLGQDLPFWSMPHDAKK